MRDESTRATKQRQRASALERRDPVRRSPPPGGNEPIACPRCGNRRMRISSNRVDRGPGEFLHVWRIAVAFECEACPGELQFSFWQRDGQSFASKYPPP
jgi:hypothetical protein